MRKLYRQVRVQITGADDSRGEFTKYLADTSAAVFKGQMTRLLNQTARKHPAAVRIEIDAIDSPADIARPDPSVQRIAAQIARAYSADYSERNLKFLADAPLSVQDLAAILPGIVPEYNGFNAQKVCAILADIAPAARVWFGREYSPVFYIEGSAADLAAIQKAARRLRADECQIYRAADPWAESLSGQKFGADVLRLWFD